MRACPDLAILVYRGLSCRVSHYQKLFDFINLHAQLASEVSVSDAGRKSKGGVYQTRKPTTNFKSITSCVFRFVRIRETIPELEALSHKPEHPHLRCNSLRFTQLYWLLQYFIYVPIHPTPSSVSLPLSFHVCHVTCHFSLLPGPELEPSDRHLARKPRS